MKLRARLFLTLAVAAVATLLLLGWAQSRIYEGTRSAALAESAIDRMESGERQRCEDRPAIWPRRRGPGQSEHGGPRAGRHRHGSEPHRPRMHAYDASFQSRNPSSPPFPPGLAEQLVAGRTVATERSGRGGRLHTAVRMPWQEGPCAVLLLRAKGPPRWLSRAALSPALLSALAVMIAAWLAAGPMVRRIRHLTEAARRLERDPSAPIEVEGQDELAELGAAFEQSRRTIESQLQSMRDREAALRDYITRTSHDVMLPLSVLQGHLVSLQQRLDAGESLEASAMTPSLEEAHYLGSLLRNLNAAARLRAQQGLQHRDRVDLNRLLDRVIDRHQPIARRKSVALEKASPEVPVPFPGDLTLLEQALGNLVQNAVRYNRAGGHVAVLLEGDERAWQLRVVDDGPGIPPEERGRVLEPDFRGNEARTRHPHGMGLGLSIVKEVADRHALGLRLEETPGGGLTAVLSFGA